MRANISESERERNITYHGVGNDCLCIWLVDNSNNIFTDILSDITTRK